MLAQYDLLAGPNGLSGDAGLRPETSTQWTAGFRWEAFKGFSFGADLEVKLKNQVLSQGIAENVGFGNPQQYAALFTNPYNDPAGFETIAFSQLPFNGGQATYQGIDWDITYAAHRLGPVPRGLHGHPDAQGGVQLWRRAAHAHGSGDHMDRTCRSSSAPRCNSS